MTKSASITALSCVFFLLSLPSCDRGDTGNPIGDTGAKPAGPHEEIIHSVTQFIGEPQNWHNGSKALAQFVEVTSKLGIGKDQEVLAFREAANDLLGVQIQWTSLNTQLLKESTEKAARTVKVAGEASISPMRPGVSVGGGFHSSDELGSAAQQVQSTVSNLLSKDLALQFTKHYGRVLETGTDVIAHVHQLKGKQ